MPPRQFSSRHSPGLRRNSGWESLTPLEQTRLIHLLGEQVGFDGRKGTLAVTFRPTGIKAFAGKLASRMETKV